MLVYTGETTGHNLLFYHLHQTRKEKPENAVSSWKVAQWVSIHSLAGWQCLCRSLPWTTVAKREEQWDFMWTLKADRVLHLWLLTELIFCFLQEVQNQTKIKTVHLSFRILKQPISIYSCWGVPGFKCVSRRVDVWLYVSATQHWVRLNPGAGVHILFAQNAPWCE